MFNSFSKVIVMMLLIFLAVGAVWTSANSYLTTANAAPTHTGVATQAALPRTAATVPATLTPAPSHRLVTLNAQNTRVAAATGNVVQVWALDSGKLLATFDSGNRSLTDIAFSPDGLSLAAGASDGSVLIWQVP